MNRKIMLTSLTILMVTGAVVFSAATVNAQADTNIPPFFKGLVERFNLNEDEVQAYMQEQRSLMQQERHENMTARLNTLVEEGTLTSEQKDALLKKMEENQTLREQHRADMQQWAEDNGIDLSVIRMGPKGDFGHGRFGSK